MVNELLAIVAILAAEFGAIASTVKGYWDTPDTTPPVRFSAKKLLSALLSSGFFAFGIVNLSGLPDQLTQLGWVGLIIANLILGFGIDKAHSTLDK